MAYKPTGNPTGRPALYTPEKVELILEPYSTGVANIRDSAINAGVKPSTFFGWVLDDVEGLADRYARARQLRALALADEVLDILDDSRNDYIEVKSQRGSFVKLNSENIRRSELRAKYRQDLETRNLPVKLGGASDATISGNINVVIDGADAEI